jgi:hypothetical protein
MVKSATGLGRQQQALLTLPSRITMRRRNCRRRSPLGAVRPGLPGNQKGLPGLHGHNS